MLPLCMIYCGIHVSLDVLDVSPLLCNVDVMISTLQKRLQDALLSLVGPSSSFRIGSHLGRNTPPHRSRVLHHNGGPNLYKSCVSCVVSSSI